MDDKYTIDFSRLATFEAIKATVLMFLRGKSGTVVYTIQEARPADRPVSRRHCLDPAKPIDDHAEMIAYDLANNFANRPRYTAATLEIK
jgi:hypothetical protein